MNNPGINTINSNRTGQKNMTAQQNRTGRNPSATANGTPHSVGRLSDYGVARGATALHEGDIVRGEISDLRNNEITLTLENNTIVKGQVLDNSMLSIGQRAAFRLNTISPGGIILEAVNQNYSETELTMINKALDEAGLPKTSHNQSAVKALMDNLLPINKESIQMLMQQSYDYNTSDMGTLAIMNRLMMHLDEESIQQFSNYRNDSYQLLTRLDSFAKDLPALLDTLAEHGPADIVSRFGEQLLNITLTSDTNTTSAYSAVPTIALLSPEQRADLTTLLTNYPMSEEIAGQLEDGTLTIRDALILLRDASGDGVLTLPSGYHADSLVSKMTLVNQSLEPMFDMPMPSAEDMVRNANIHLEDEVLPVEAEEVLPEAATEITTSQESPENSNTFGSRLAHAGRLFQSFTENTFQTINDALQQLQSNPMSENTLSSDTVFDALTSLHDSYSRNYDLLGNYLNIEERTALLHHLQKLPISQSLLDKISTGEATTKEVLTVIKNIIPLSDASQIKELFQSASLEALFTKALLSGWTLTPEKLKNDADISSFYHNMQTQMEQFENLIQSSLSGQDSENLGQAAHDMNSNIQFMKTLQEMFSYMQLPLKLQNQDAHGDLYVYTKKEKIRQNPEKLRLLLHLELEHLGVMDIHIDKNYNDIQTRFLLDNEPAMELIRNNAEVLKAAINEHGYACQVSVEQADTHTSTVNEFINTKINTSATTEMKRFSFDIRA